MVLVTGATAVGTLGSWAGVLDGVVLVPPDGLTLGEAVLLVSEELPVPGEVCAVAAGCVLGFPVMGACAEVLAVCCCDF